MAIDRQKARERLHEEFVHFGLLFAYLLTVLTLLQLHEFLVDLENGIPYTHFGFAIINALVLAKVMLIADQLRLGEGWFPNHPLAVPIVARSLMFATVLVLSDIVEKLIESWFKHHLVVDLPFGAIVLRSVVNGLILAIALLPFFAFVELAKVLGGENLRRFLLQDRRPQ